MLQILLASGFILLAAVGWYANRALKQVQADELAREEEAARAADPEVQHEQQQQQGDLARDSCGATSSISGPPVRQSFEDSAMQGRDGRPDLDVLLGEKGEKEVVK